MISKCANPACPVPFLYLHEGRLFRVMREPEEIDPLRLGVDPTLKKRSRRVEFYWLCTNCASKMTIRYEKETGVVVKPFHAYRAAS